ncbi:molecular chaperone HtpG [Tundrisphaera sp. TA3]|uniref:molecular chaperone HtpG n=1 Tax=Tundrisphaera sp. TA3 TaxID=3435775 RepID=UPI003EB70D97
MSESAAPAETHEYAFQAEIKQLLHLLSHSLYQSRDVAIRELISNASDALDKQRYLGLTDESRRDDAPLEITLEGKADDKTLTIRDNGVGMTRDELVTNLGTIAHSGSREFLRAARDGAASSPSGKPDLSLIGQFGVGFYAAFMIADRVVVRSRSVKEEAGHEWRSDGSGSFTVGDVADLPRGTEIVLHLKDDAKDYANAWKLNEVIRRYSSFVPYPIKVDGVIANSQKPIWVEPKSQVTEEQYEQFYQHLTHHPEEKPLWHLHLSADSPIQFHAVLYCPPTNPEKLGFGVLDHGLSLCARRVLVQADCRELVPEYLRFLHGLVDSEDLPLNVSRETLQDNAVVRRIRTSLVKGVLDLLTRMAADKPEDYARFYETFGIFIKEGVARDQPNREKLAKLLRFASTRSEGDEPTTSLDEYAGRMIPDQTHIYYLGGPDLASVRRSPNLEIFRRKGVEVLFLTEPVDEFVMSALGEFGGKTLTSIDSADLDLPGEEPKAEDKPESHPGGFGRVLDLFREALGTRVQEVRASKRLTESPCCLVNAEGALSTQMHRLLAMSGKEAPPVSRSLEVNPDSPLIGRLALLAANPDNDAFIKDCALQLWSGAMILEGSLPEPEDLAARMQRFVEKAAEGKSAIVI